MGLLVLTKKKTATEAAPGPSLSEFAEAIDLVGRLTEEAEPILKRIATENERLKPLGEAKAALAKLIEGMEIDPDATSIELGTAFYAEVGKQGTSRSITDMKKVRALMGDELFFKVATVTLKDCDSYLTPDQKALFIKEQRTSRSLKIIKRV